MRKLIVLLIAAGLCVAQTPRFPTNVATDADLLTARDRVQGKLLSPVGSTDTVIAVQGGAGFVPNMLVTIDAEVISICGVSSNNLTVGINGVCPSIGGRGLAYGSAAANHSIGPCSTGNSTGCVSAFITAFHHNTLAKEIEAIETALGPNLSTAFTNINMPTPGSLPTSIYNAAHFNLGNLPITNEWGANSTGLTQALVGANNYNSALLTIGVAGYANSHGGPAVGLLGQCTVISAGGACWGANLLAVQNGIFTNLAGNEIDIGASPASMGPAPANMTGEAAVTGGYQQATIDHVAWSAQLADLPNNHVFFPFIEAFQSKDGAALSYGDVGALYLVENTSYTYAQMTGTTWNDSVQNVIWCSNCNVANPCTAGGSGAYARKSGGGTPVFDCSAVTSIPSQDIRFRGWDSSKTQHVGYFKMDGGGNFILAAGSGYFTFQNTIGANRLIIDTDGGVYPGPVTFSGLASVFGNGKQIFCSDCKNSVDDSVAVGSTAAGSGHGAFVSRVNGSWRTMN